MIYGISTMLVWPAGNRSHYKDFMGGPGGGLLCIIFAMSLENSFTFLIRKVEG